MERLPTEIIIEICSSLCYHCRPCPDNKFLLLAPALLNLCLTSSRLRAIAQPILYHHIHIDHNGKSCTDLLNTIIDRPDLARAVRWLIVSDSLDEDEEETMKDLVFRDWSGAENSVVQQLLVQIPLVEVLWVGSQAPEAWGLRFFVDGPDTQSLPTLRTVRIAHWDRYSGFDPSTMTDLFLLATNINSLAIRYGRNLSCMLPIQNVTCLILEECTFSTRRMRWFLLSCGKLDTFAYHGTFYKSDDGEISTNELVKLLEELGHSRTLRRLSLQYYVLQERICSLASFAQLQILQLNSWIFRETMCEGLPAEWLPPSLEEIGLYDDYLHEECIEWISAKASSGFFHRLRKITLDRLEGIKEKFQHLNITCLKSKRFEIGEWLRAPGGAAVY
ncbi:hypothetical protein F4679DRAFT_274338 [Xylaria curta]|nr:hypothetical protein F4679DRAFT_274338 [Xylaria curta]